MLINGGERTNSSAPLLLQDSLYQGKGQEITLGMSGVSCRSLDVSDTVRPCLTTWELSRDASIRTLK